MRSETRFKMHSLMELRNEAIALTSKFEAVRFSWVPRQNNHVVRDAATTPVKTIADRQLRLAPSEGGWGCGLRCEDRGGTHALAFPRSALRKKKQQKTVSNASTCKATTKRPSRGLLQLRTNVHIAGTARALKQSARRQLAGVPPAQSLSGSQPRTPSSSVARRARG